MTNYETRVRALEAEGCTRSDAQAIIDAQDMRPNHCMLDVLAGWDKIENPPELTNTDRAEFARYGLAQYQRNKEAHEPDELLETIAIDFLADLMHMADEEKLDFPRCLAMAQGHYREETQS